MKSNKSNKSHHFWNSCPRKLDYIPKEPCSQGKPTPLQNGRITSDPECEWWINSEKHGYCFWRYIRDKSKPDGSMKELLQSDLAVLFGCSSTKIHFILKEAMKELEEAIKNSDKIDTDNIDDSDVNNNTPYIQLDNIDQYSNDDSDSK